jgi:hypothetical protein
MTPSSSQSERYFMPSAAILAWLWPGLGHISLGQRKRGFLIMGGMLLLFFTGLLVGSLDCVDSRNASLWFIAQAGCGPLAFAADFIGARIPDDPMRESLGHVNEMGTLFIALAGLMNVVVILDALYPRPKAKAPKQRRKGEAT